jgi:NAD(P)-dependent dehydrogenase (short-subunit alcohol dehydrogenase family)
MTKDGYEAQWQTNHLAHWLFTHQLLPLMQRTAQTSPPGTVRVVNLSSGGHLGAPKSGINFADTTLKDASGMTRYGQSKLANILHMKILHQQYGAGSDNAKAGKGEIWCTAVHPGLVSTNIGTQAELPFWMRMLILPLQMTGQAWDADKGSWTNLYCVASPDMKKEHAGVYFERIAKPNGWQSGKAKDMELARKLEEWTASEMRKGGWIE